MEKNKKKKIIIATGGTGGHIIPAVSLFETLKSDYDTEITTDKRGVKSVSYTHLTLPTKA